MPPLFAAILFVAVASAEESGSPEQLLKPRDFNPHPYDNPQVLFSKFYKHLSTPEPTKEGPVLFPNDAPPPPKPPLIVTSRPLSESISRSELNTTPDPLNNSLAQPSYLSRVQIIRPNYAPINFYKKPKKIYKLVPNYSAYVDPNLDNFPPYGNIENNLSPYRKVDSIDSGVTNDVYYRKPKLDYAPINFYKKPSLPINEDLAKHNLDVGQDYGAYDEGKVQYRHPYASLLKKARIVSDDRHRYSDYEEQTILPPIYKALSDHARQKVLKIASNPAPLPSKPPQQQYKEKDGSRDYNDYSNEVDKDSDYGKNYAFSYTVRDHKTGDDFSHSQRSSGAATNGEYRVRLPDGRMQIVSYTADEGGYKADVRYAEDDVKPIDNDIDNERRVQDSRPKPRPENSKDYYNRYDSKEYFNDDYEYGNKVQYNTQRNFENPTTISNKFRPIVVANDYNVYKNKASVTPSYSDTILITPTKRPFYLVQTTPKYIYNSIPVHINVPSTTPSPNYSFRQDYGNTERVVNIGSSPKSPLLYTNIQNRLSHSDLSQVPVSTASPLYNNYSVTPLYPSSTSNPLNIGSANQKSNLSNFVSRFNKYLRFN